MMQQVQPKSAATRADATTVRSPTRPIRRVGTLLSTSCDHDVPIETIADLVGHASTAVTDKVYRHQLRPVITTGATTMNAIFNQQKQQYQAQSA